MGCKRLNTDFFNFLEIVHSKKSAPEEKKRINYYPFGLKHRGYNNVTSSNGNSVAQKFGYNGKELNEELGLNWHDFTARNYDASLGRWMNLDPLAEQMRRHSPYNYAYDNPVYFIDPDGMKPHGPGNPIVKAIVKALKRIGRRGKQKKLRSLVNDPKVGKADKGWVKSEINQIKKKKRKSIRNPPGKDLAHERGREAAKGYDYSHTNLQDRSLHKLQHKHDKNGLLNKERPVTEATAVAVTTTATTDEGSIETSNTTDSSSSSSSITGSSTMDGILDFSYSFISFFDNLGTTIFGENTDAATITNDLNPLNMGVSELFKPLMEKKKKEEKKDEDKKE